MSSCSQRHLKFDDVPDVLQRRTPLWTSPRRSSSTLEGAAISRTLSTSSKPRTSAALPRSFRRVAAGQNFPLRKAECVMALQGRPQLLHINNTPKTPSSQLQAFSLSPVDHVGNMEFFRNAKAVRLRSRHNKYLIAEDDEESVTLERNGSSPSARWTLEYVHHSDSLIRLKSQYSKYLTASDQAFLLGSAGCKVLQTIPHRLDSSVEWEPVRDGSRVRLKTRCGNFLRANGGPPPWRNSVTHDVPYRASSQELILWDVDVVEIEVRSPTGKVLVDSFSYEEPASSPKGPNLSDRYSRQESNGSPPKSEGRTIYYHIAGENGEIEGEDMEGFSMHFNESTVEELTKKLEEDTGIQGIYVCSRSPLNRKLFPLRLQLPPNIVTMHVVVVPQSSIAAEGF